jgi:DNA-binding response OmpR family regulator
MAHILLLEPNRLLAETYAKALRALGHSIDWSPSAQTAISQADQQVPDIVVTELQLAGHSGIEFLYEFRSYADWQTVPVLVLSHVPQEDSGIDQRIMGKIGIEAYLYKPKTSLKKLAQIINRKLQPA